MKREKSCGAVVINDKSEVLLVKHNAGHISFPKGHIEENETEVMCAYREVLEETGIKIKIDGNVREVSVYNSKPDTIKEVVFFKAMPINNEIKVQIEEVSEVYFIDVDKALEIITYENDKKILEQILERSDKHEY